MRGANSLDADREALPRRAGLSGGWLTLLFAIVVGAGTAVSLLADGPPTAEIGEPAPPLAFNAFDGSRFDLQRHFDEGGGPVVLNLWASWCEPCRREFPALSEYALARADVTVIGVAVQDQLDDARDFATRMRPGFKVGYDTNGAIREAFPSFGLPTTFVISADGTVADIILAELTPERLAEIQFDGGSNPDGAA